MWRVWCDDNPNWAPDLLATREEAFGRALMQALHGMPAQTVWARDESDSLQETVKLTVHRSRRRVTVTWSFNTSTPH